MKSTKIEKIKKILHPNNLLSIVKKEIPEATKEDIIRAVKEMVYNGNIK